MTVTLEHRQGGLLKSGARSRRGASALIAVGIAAACAPPTLVHHDGHPLAVGAEPIAIDGGWIGFDECESGFHALVELQLTADPDGGRPADLARLSLTVGRGEATRPSSVSVAGPFCPALEGERRATTYGSYAVDRQNLFWMTGNPIGRCMYMIRAQFDLSAIPAEGEQAQLVTGVRTILLTRR